MLRTDDPDSEDDANEDPDSFVGRVSEREDIKHALLHSYRAVQLVGPPMVGKARLALKVSKELQQELAVKDIKLICYNFCCKDVKTEMDILARFSAALDLRTTARTSEELWENFKSIWSLHPKSFHFFVCFRCEALYSNDLHQTFLDLIARLMDISKRVFALITSQQGFNMGSMKACEVKIKPLSDEDTVTLVQRCAPDLDIEPYAKVITKHCRGLPPLAMDAAQELMKTKETPLSAEELDHILSPENRSTRVHSATQDPLVSAALRRFLGLNDYLKQRIVDISIFKGSFSMDAALRVLGPNQAVAKQCLGQLRHANLLVDEDGTSRMRLETLTDYFVRNVTGSHVRYDDAVRLRFVKLFVDVLKKADSELFIKPQQTVFGYLHNDWSNLQQVMEQAIHCTQDTYGVFLQVARSAETLLVKCFPGEAVAFYEAMMWAATRFGTREECAMQKWLLGMAKTLGRGTDLEEAMGLYKEALPILITSERNRECLVALLADMGLNYSRQGKNAKSKHCFLQALEEANRCIDCRKLTNRIVNIRCLLAIPLIFLEHYDEAEKLLMETLAESDRNAPYHPARPIMINSLGLLYERAGRSDETALHYYMASLAERRVYADVAPGDLVVVLNNVAMLKSKAGNHDFGIQLLSEAKTIRMKLGRCNYHTALTCWNMGHIYGRMGDISNALLEMKDALEIFKKCTKSHFVILEVLLPVCHYAAHLQMYTDAEDYLLEALEMEAVYMEYHPTGSHILLVLQHLIMMFIKWKQKCTPFLDRAIAEAARLVDLDRSLDSLDKTELFRKQQDILCEITFDDRTSAEDILKDLTQSCYICEDLRSRKIHMLPVFSDIAEKNYRLFMSGEVLLKSHHLKNAVNLLKKSYTDSLSPPISPPPTDESDRFEFGIRDVASELPLYPEEWPSRMENASLNSGGHLHQDAWYDHHGQGAGPQSYAYGDLHQTHVKGVMQTVEGDYAHICARPTHEMSTTKPRQYYDDALQETHIYERTYCKQPTASIMEPFESEYTPNCVGPAREVTETTCRKNGQYELQNTYISERTCNQQPVTSYKDTHGSLGIGDLCLKQERLTIGQDPLACSSQKLREVEETMPGPYIPPSNHCSFDPTLRYPPGMLYMQKSHDGYAPDSSTQKGTFTVYSRQQQNESHNNGPNIPSFNHCSFHPALRYPPSIPYMQTSHGGFAADSSALTETYSMYSRQQENESLNNLVQHSNLQTRTYVPHSVYPSHQQSANLSMQNCTSSLTQSHKDTDNNSVKDSSIRSGRPGVDEFRTRLQSHKATLKSLSISTSSQEDYSSEDRRRISNSSGVSSAQSSHLMSSYKTPNEHDDRQQGPMQCCNEPNCGCSISRTK